MDQEKIGRFIQTVRKGKGLTQAQLAEKLGVSQKSVSRWETGKNLPDISLFPELCKELDINIAELINGEVYEGDLIEKSKVSTAAEGMSYLFNQNRLVRNLIGAIISLIVTICCMAGAYNYEFSVRVDSTDALERAIETYRFNSTSEVNVLESTSVGSRLIVLYDRVDENPGIGIAILEKGLFGKYRICNCKDPKEFGIYSFQQEINDISYLIIACADNLPDYVSSYGILGYDQSRNTTINYNELEIIYSAQYFRSPFLAVVEIGNGIHAAHNTVYYDEAHNEYSVIQVAEEMGIKYGGSSGSSIGTAEMFLIYWLEAIILVLGMIFIRYFLLGMKEARPIRRASSKT